jgi:molecular chaperone HscB
MQPALGKNHFELFELPVSFEVDLEDLALRYRELQRAVHPDRFANASEQEKRVSVQHAAQINEAFQVLKQPMSRARYLLVLNDMAIDDTDTQMDPAFLMEQMELREALAEVRGAADPFAALNQARDTIEARERELVESLQQAFADGGAQALEGARESVRKMQFMQRLLSEVDDMEETLVHEI